MNLLVIDNYDSFTYNLVHYLEQLADNVVVWRNNEIQFSNLSNFDAILLSPGPGLPKDAGDLMKCLEHCKESHPIFGVCLGLQAIYQHFGGRLRNLQEVIHGRKTRCKVNVNDPLFYNLPEEIEIGHYHSWVADESDIKKLPLQIIAENEKGLVMAIRHSFLPIKGVQFHPESVLTPMGFEILKNWVQEINQK